jgi:hypothetical protein
MASLVFSSYNGHMPSHHTTLRQISVCTLALFFLISVTQTAFAASPLPSGSFVVRPAKIELDINPGEEKTTILTLSNGTALPLVVNVSYEDVAPIAQHTPLDESVALLGKNGGAYPLRELFHTKTNSLQILSGGALEVPITIRIPKDAEAGGRYGSVVLSFAPVLMKGEPMNANVAVESRLATLFYVRINGSTKEEGQLVSFGLFNNARFVRAPSEESPLHFQVTFENSGAVHLNPYGRMTITSFFGAALTIPIEPQAVLPGGTRVREVDVFSDLAPGYYHAHLEENRGYADIVDDRDVTFWILPSPLGSVWIVIGLFVALFIIRRSLQLSKHRIS